jgi:hypothetical protein
VYRYATGGAEKAITRVAAKSTERQEMSMELGRAEGQREVRWVKRNRGAPIMGPVFVKQHSDRTYIVPFGEHAGTLLDREDLDKFKLVCFV